MDFYEIVLIIVFSSLFVVLLFLLILFNVIAYRAFLKTIVKRYDYDPQLIYFNVSDYTDIKSEEFSFKSGSNTLKGSKYYNDNVKEDVVAVFFHGIGAGHQAYFKEIRNIVINNNITVYSYDNTGCGNSEGKDIIELQHGLKDSNAFFKHLREELDLSNKKIILFGHSWGGFVALNTPSVVNDLQFAAVVAFNPLISVNTAVKASLGKVPFFMAFYNVLSKIKLGSFANKDGIKSIKKANNTKYLIINGGRDNLISLQISKEHITKYKFTNVELITLENQGHFGYLSKNAEEKTLAMFSQLNKLKETKDSHIVNEFIKNINYDEIGENNYQVFDRIKEFIKEVTNAR